MAFRLDISSELRPAQRMDDGRVRVDAFITRAGVFSYLNSDGSTRLELRDPSEVFNPASMRSFEMIPVTNNHPGALLSAADAKKYMVGMTGENVSRDDERIRTNLMVADEATIKQMDAGKIQVSCGYNCTIDPTPGVHPLYGRYDMRQTNIRGNHVAIVDKGRAGDAHIRMDAGTDIAIADLANPVPIAKIKELMDPNKDLVSEAAKQVAALTTRADTAESALAAEKTRADTAEGTVEMLKAQLAAAQAGPKPADIESRDAQIMGLQKLVAAEKARADAAESPDVRRAAVKARVAIETAAAAVMGDTRLDSFDDRQLMNLVIEKLLGKAIDAERSDDYVRACFDTALNGYFGSKDALAKLREAVLPKNPQPRVDAMSARQTMIENIRNSSKPMENK